MNPGAILIGVAILVLALPYVANPLINKRKKQPARAGSQKEQALSRQKGALDAIRDLDFDFQIGKITQEDYDPLRAQLVFEAAGYLQQKKLEDEKVEEMIRLPQSVQQSARCEHCGAELHTQDAFCPTCGIAVKAQASSEKPPQQFYCPECGKRIREKDLYCTGCGALLSVRLEVEYIPLETETPMPKNRV